MTTIYLVKEADSGHPGSWPGPPKLRPLTREGRRQARDLATHLEARPISRILTGPNLRCRETVIPLADARGLAIESDEALGDVAGVKRALDLIRAAGAGPPPGPLLICAHADLVDAMVAQLVLDGWVDEDGGSLQDGILWQLEEPATTAG